MKELLVATKNKGKVLEIADLLAPTGIKVMSLLDFDQAPEIVEDGQTFRANAAKKAVMIAQYIKTFRFYADGRFDNVIVMGEDSGIEVDALSGRPGVHSARYAGPQATDQMNNKKLLAELAEVPMSKRTARYRCAMALSDQSDLIDVAEGSCEGLIAIEPKGANGFGYDPLFFVPSHQKTFGELPLAVKQTMSHRAEALRKFLKLLERYLAVKDSWA